MTKMNLKPCPFCGGEAHKKHAFGQYTFVCSVCGIVTQPSNNEEKAIKIWNTRQIEDNEIKYEPTSYSCKACKNATDSEIKRLREALEEIQDAITLLNTADVLEHISDRINQTLKGKEE